VADLVNEGSPPDRADDEASPLARRRPAPNVPRHRFGIAYLILAAALGAAVGLFIVLTANGGNHSGPGWSTWKPTQSGVRRLNEISKHVEGRYALANGRRLALVLSTPPEVQGQSQPVPLRAIAVSSGLAGETARDASFYDASTAWAFNFCGSGKKCALPGQPSVSRYDLLRREALELALYTFKYEPSVESVIAYMPPAVNAGSGSATDTAIFLRRQDVAEALKHPLDRTLTPGRASLRPGHLTKRETELVRKYTDSRLYQYSFQELQDGTPVLALVPLQA
jgi:hypothetical protein